MIKRISVVNQQGSNTYQVGDTLDAGIVHEIKVHPLYFTGDPFSHYCGFDKNGKLLFSLEPSLPCDVEYL